MSLILVPLFGAILQLGLLLYVRNTLAACAQEGARYGSDENLVAQPGDVARLAAKGRTVSCIEHSVSDAYAQHVDVAMTTRAVTGGAPVPVVEVRVTSPAPVFGFFGVGDQILHATADAMQELP